MPRFYFHLRDGKCAVDDDRGEDLPDALAARDYAVRIAHELMRGRELRTRHYCLDAIDEHGGAVAEVPFATVDPTLNHLHSDLRNLIERLCNTRRELYETLVGADWLTRELQARRARSHGKPHLITCNGRRV